MARGCSTPTAVVSVHEVARPTGLFISEQDVADRLSMPATVAAVKQSFLRLADGLVHQAPRVQLMVSAGYFAAICGADEWLGLATVKSYMVIDGQLRGFVITASS